MQTLNVIEETSAKPVVIEIKQATIGKQNWRKFFLSRHGQIVTLQFTSCLTKDHPNRVRSAFRSEVIVKTSVIQARVGVSYDNIGDVKNGRANGTLPSENQGLKGKVWKQFPYFKESLKTGKELASFRSIDSSMQRKTFWTLNGASASFDAVSYMLYAKSKSARPIVFDIPSEEIDWIR